MNAAAGATRIRRPFVVVAALSLAAMVAGCGGGANALHTAATCPKLVRLPDTDTMALFNPGGHQLKDVVIAAKILNGNVECRREADGVAVNAEISFEAERGALTIPGAPLPYFVALVDQQEHVLAQNSFVVPLKFVPGDRIRRMPAEKITVHVPTRNVETAGQYSVIVGFQLTPDQLAFNRATHSQ